MNAKEFTQSIEVVGAKPDPWAKRFRRAWDDLWTSRYVRALEIELVNVRLDKNRQIGALEEEKRKLWARIVELEELLLLKRPTAIPGPPPKPVEPKSDWQSILAARVAENEKAAKEENQA